MNKFEKKKKKTITRVGRGWHRCTLYSVRYLQASAKASLKGPISRGTESATASRPSQFLWLHKIYNYYCHVIPARTGQPVILFSVVVVVAVAYYLASIPVCNNII